MRTPKVGWDFEDEHPDIDARGFTAEGTLAPEVETHLVNAVLTNGARYYVDHAHPELSTPECADPRSIVVYDKAAELILQRSMRAAVSALPDGQEIVVYKNNSDGKGNSYGCHENYLMDRQVPFGRIVAHVMPHFISRQVFTGAGKVGTEVVGLTCEPTCPSSSPSGPTSSRRRSGWRPRSSGPSSTPATSPTPTPSATGACTSSWATPTCPRWPRSSRWAPPPWCWP